MKRESARHHPPLPDPSTHSAQGPAQDMAQDMARDFAGGLAARYVGRAAEVVDAVRILAGPDAATCAQVMALASRFGLEWERIATNRGLDLPTIVLVGGRNVGKSTLCKLLIGDQRVREEIRSGEAASLKTTRLQWIGPRRPPNLAEGAERHLLVDAGAMADLGRPYMLLDPPGAGDVDPAPRELAATALSSARYKVLVLDAGRIEDLDGVRSMRDADGSVILPVVRLRGEQTLRMEREEDGLRAEYDQALATLRAALPLSTVLPCLLLPDLGIGDPEQARQTVQDRLTRGLRDMLNTYRDQGESRIEELTASWERFRFAVADLLAPVLRPGLREAFARLEARADDLPIAAANHLLADHRKIKALLRSDLRLELQESMPFWAFPLRSLSGMLCHATGALDRVILALGGSLPSVIMTGFTAFKNVTEQAEARAALRDNLKQDLQGIVQRNMAEPMEDFGAAVRRATGGQEPAERRAVEFDVQGGEELAGTWERAVRENVKSNALGRTWVWAPAFLATLVFWFLMGAPLVHLYGQYIPTAFQSWTGEWTLEALTAYPSLPARFWLTAVPLSILPVFLTALALVSAALRPKRVEHCATLLRERFPKVALQEANLRITIRDPRIQAARLLLGLSA